MEFSGCLNDESIGPAVEGCRDNFDFTIKFEKVFLELIPTVIFIAICLPRAAHLLRKPVIVGGALLRGAKLVRIWDIAGRQLLIEELLDGSLPLRCSPSVTPRLEQRQVATL